MSNNYDFWDDIVIVPEDIIVLKDLDVESQLHAIDKLKQLHFKYKSKLKDEIYRTKLQALNHHGDNNDWEVDCHIESIHNSIYAEGALCLSFVGLILPLTETMFVRFFKHLGENWAIDKIISSARWKVLNKKDLWDCSLFVNHQMKILPDIREGILQLCKDTGFSKYLNPEFSKMLTLLFKFRNNLFHNGMEWPLNKRKEFQKLLNDLEYNQFFRISTSDGKPWMFTMTDEYLDQCQRLVKESYYSMNKYCMDNALL